MTMPAGEPGLAAVPVRDRGEMLINVAASSPLAGRRRPPCATGRYPGPTYLRTGVVDRLVVAQSLLPRDLLLLVVAGYWPATLAPDSATAADAGLLPAAHPTGGAVDLTLCGSTSTPLRLDRRLGVLDCLTCASMPTGVASDPPEEPAGGTPGHADHRSEDHRISVQPSSSLVALVVRRPVLGFPDRGIARPLRHSAGLPHLRLWAR